MFEAPPGPLPPALAAKVTLGATLVAAGANVVMQLSRAPIGRAVATSPVPEGSLTHHPLRRTRTTLGYVMAALVGEEELAVALAREVNAQHRRVRTVEDPSRPALDPELQRWVALCMVRGVFDVLDALGVELSEEEGELLLAHGSRFATLLQVSIDSWPGDRLAFEADFAKGLAACSFDEVTRPYLYDLASLRFLPGARPLAGLHRFLVAGFLPEPLAAGLGLTLGERGRRRHRRLTRALGALSRRLPRALAAWPWTWALADLRRRHRRGQPLLSRGV